MIVRFVACVGLFTLVVTPAKAWCFGRIAAADAFDACEVGTIPERIEDADRPRDHRLSQEKFGTELWYKGDVAGALDSFKAAFAILDSRAKSDPENIELQSGLSRILSSIASLQVLTGNREEAHATYVDRLAIEDKLASSIEREEVKARAFGNVSWYALLARDPAKALMAAKQALAVTPDEPWIRINLAHALLLLGRTTEARALYERIAAMPNKRWKQMVVEDFGKLRKAGVTHSLMPTIEAALDR
jgi:tetratricopeptide (TPR) repeat protein